MINWVEIKIECIHQYDGTVPDNIVMGHLLNYYRYDIGAKLYGVHIEVGSDDSLTVTRNGYYIDIAKTLGITEIRAAIINGSERIMQLYDDCILNKNIVPLMESEEKAGFNEIYKLIYFKDKILLKDYASIISMFDGFVTKDKIEVYTVLFNVEENCIAIHLKTTKRRFLEDSNALFRFLIDVNKIHRIDTLNGVKLKRYWPPK